MKKLGFKEGMTVHLVNPPDNYSTLTGVSATKGKIPPGGWDFIHFFTNRVSELEAVLPGLKDSLNKQGMIWVSWYKKSSEKSSELSDTVIRDCALAIGLVDVKVCAIDEDWSGLKLVFRLKDR